MIRRVCIVVAAVLLLSHTAAAASYFVRPDGHDGASGLNNSNDASNGAWLTLQHAADVVSAGDTVHVDDGSYVGFMLQTAGTATAPITFRASGTGAIIATRNPTTNDGINVESWGDDPTDYVVIDGFVVRDQPRMGIRAIGGTGIVIRNNTTYDNSDCGIFSGNTPAIQVLNNTTYNNGSNGFQHNIYISNALSDNCVISGNLVYGANEGNGIQLNGDWQEGGDGFIDNALIENNIVFANQAKGLSLISVRYGRFQNNIIFDNVTSAGGIHLVDQLGQNFSIDNVVVNNTIDEPTIACVRINAGNTGNVVFNNICVGSRGIVFEGSGNTQGNNILASSGTDLFVDRDNQNFHLTSSSLALNQGVSSFQSFAAPVVDIDGTERPQGGSFDCGAYEVAESDTIAPSRPTGLRIN